MLVIAVTLIVFIGQQMYYVTVNKTQVELDKIEAVMDAKEKLGDKTPYVHFYDHGIIENWKEFLFPPKIEKHKPMDYSKEIAEFEAEEAERKAKKHD